MGITTKTGDSGKTSLLCGKRVFKDDDRVQAYGTLDELCCFLGLTKSLVKKQAIKKIIEGMQRDLFVICTEMATPSEHLAKLKNRINNKHVGKLEKLIEEYQKQNKSQAKGFCLPGENVLSGSLDVTRAIARRAERWAVILKRKKIIKNSDIIIYLNRLSDFLYLLARNYEQKPKGK